EGDRSLLWRVAGSSRDGEVSSEVGTLSWQEPTMTALGPEDGAVAGEGADLVFTFEAPVVCLRPMVVISGAGDFGDRRQCYRVPAKRGEMQALLPAKRMAALLKKDDGDGVFYWRVEDVGAKRTGVAASEVRSFALAP
ncbi:MAG: hypothetical protein JW741_30135, partial [Sedimentisphaerales bacterium]|nr:hypothetical protein [Sedimentisphaerales bacterium]